jgi:hypothetical protein
MLSLYLFMREEGEGEEGEGEEGEGEEGEMRCKNENGEV